MSDAFRGQRTVFAMEISFVIHFEDVIAVGKRRVTNDIVHVGHGYHVTFGGTAIKFDRTLNPIQGGVVLLQPIMTQVNGKIVQVMNQEENVFTMSLDG